MFISVIIPTYRPQNYLWECLSSLGGQTMSHDDFEIIIVLNGCCEPYNTQIKEWLSTQKSLNVNYIQIDRGGVSNARNLALDVAKGDYITFIDDDDFVSPTYLEELYNNATPQVVSLCYPLSFLDGTTEYRPYLITKDYEKNISLGVCDYKKAKKFFSGPVYKLIHKSIIGERRFDLNFKNGEDSIFMFLISDRMEKISFTSRNAIYYRRVRENSATTLDRSLMAVAKNSFAMIVSYWKIYMKRPRSYDFGFFFTRILGSIRTILCELF
ncbi:MAG: glycosyltransferase [Paludibacteraceae bacterium]|nr:glycosyltransferase [Paludibacteraceae bacterium]